MTTPRSRFIDVADYPTGFRDPWVDDDGMLHFQLGVKRPSQTKVMQMFRNAARLTRYGTRLLVIDARAMRLAPPAGVWTFAPYRLASIARVIAFLFSEMTTTEVRKFQKGGSLRWGSRTRCLKKAQR
jgi:hypothetical protein